MWKINLTIPSYKAKRNSHSNTPANTNADQWCFDVGPQSTTLAQHENNIGKTSRVCWDRAGISDWHCRWLNRSTMSPMKHHTMPCLFYPGMDVASVSLCNHNTSDTDISISSYCLLALQNRINQHPIQVSFNAGSATNNFVFWNHTFHGRHLRLEKWEALSRGNATSSHLLGRRRAELNTIHRLMTSIIHACNK